MGVVRVRWSTRELFKRRGDVHCSLSNLIVAIMGIEVMPIFSRVHDFLEYLPDSVILLAVRIRYAGIPTPTCISYHYTGTSYKYQY